MWNSELVQVAFFLACQLWLLCSGSGMWVLYWSRSSSSSVCSRGSRRRRGAWWRWWCWRWLWRWSLWAFGFETIRPTTLHSSSSSNNQGEEDKPTSSKANSIEKEHCRTPFELALSFPCSTENSELQSWSLSCCAAANHAIEKSLKSLWKSWRFWMMVCRKDTEKNNFSFVANAVFFPFWRDISCVFVSLLLLYTQFMTSVSLTVFSPA